MLLTQVCTLSLFIPLSLCLHLSVSFSLSLSLCLYLSVSISLSLSLCLYLSVSISLYLCLSLALSVYLSPKVGLTINNESNDKVKTTQKTTNIGSQVRRQLFAQNILSVKIQILPKLIWITINQELVGPPEFTRIFIVISVSLSLSFYVSLSLPPDHPPFSLPQIKIPAAIVILGLLNTKYLPNVSHQLSLAYLLLMICMKDW
jgi:hypothetical protein